MNYGNKNINFVLSVVISLLLLVSCNKKRESEILYTKPLEENLDSTCKWLKAKEHFYNDNYITTFYNYYNEKLKKNDYESAVKALEIVAEKKVYYLVFDVKFQNTLNDFSKKYKSEIPAINSTFIDSYFGNYYTDESNFKKAVTYFEKIIEFEPKNYTTCINKARAHYDLSFCYLNMGDQNIALENNLKALEYYNKTDNLSGRGEVYTSFSSIYLATNNFEKAHQNIDKATTYYKQANDFDNVFISLYNKIRIYDESNSSKKYTLIDSTYNLLKKSNIKDDALKIMIDTYYVEKLLAENNNLEAKKVLEELKPIVKRLNSTTSTQEYNVALAMYEINNKNKNIDVSIIENALPTLKENESYQIIINFYTLLKDKAINNNDYKAAFHYQEELKNATDSLASKEMKNKVLELDQKYETAKKETKIELQQKTIQKNNFSIAFLAAVLLVLSISVVVVSLIKKQKKLKLEKEKSLNYTKQLLEKTEEERQRIATDLHDSVSHELLNLKNSVATDFNQVNTKIDSIINDIRVISRNLHPVMFDKIGLQASIEQLVERVQIKNNFMVTADINYDHSLSSNNELQVYRIVQEALSNIIKYADAVAAKIIIQKKNNKLKIVIKDNGKGFDVEEKLKNSDAFGLHNIIERSRVIGGKAKIVSNSNGTIITIEIKN